MCVSERDRKRRATFDASRPSAASRGYGKVWQAVRARVLAEEPWCRMHAEWGERVEATEVDHVDGNASNLARSNLRPLCKAHHSQRTARDQAFGRRHRGVVEDFGQATGDRAPPTTRNFTDISFRDQNGTKDQQN